MTRKPYSTWEEGIIRTYIPNHGIAAVVNLLQRTRQSVRNKARYMGLCPAPDPPRHRRKDNRQSVQKIIERKSHSK